MITEMGRWGSLVIVRRLDHPTGYPGPLKPGLLVDVRVNNRQLCQLDAALALQRGWRKPNRGSQACPCMRPS